MRIEKEKGRNRVPQVNELVRAELAMLIARTVEFPKGSLVTITRVQCDSEIKHADVFVSIFPIEKEKEVLLLLKKLSGPLQYELNRKLEMRFVPQLHYKIEDQDDAQFTVEHILDTIKDEQ